MLVISSLVMSGVWSAAGGGIARNVIQNCGQPKSLHRGEDRTYRGGRAVVRRLHARAPLQENALIRLSEADVVPIFAARLRVSSG